MEFYIEKRFTFEASHKLINPKLNKEENKKIFGKCYDCVSHGHSYKMLVGVAGEIDENGMIINFSELKKIVNELIINKVDHKYLNSEVDFLKGKPTTCENMIVKFWGILEDYFIKNEKGKHIEKIYLKKIQLWEQEDSSVTMMI